MVMLEEKCCHLAGHGNFVFFEARQGIAGLGNVCVNALALWSKALFVIKWHAVQVGILSDSFINDVVGCSYGTAIDYTFSAFNE